MFFSFSYKPYIVIIGDIKNSRTIKQRSEVQEKLKQTLKTVNEKYASDIAAQFMITLGDEFQGLLDKGEHILDIIKEIQVNMYPVRFRFGIGVGSVSTVIDQTKTREIDGSCYHNARNAVEYLKQNEKRNHNNEEDIRIAMEKDTYDTACLINTVFSLMSVIEHGWSERQRAIIYDFSHYRDGQEKCAARLGIAQSSVQRGLMNSNYYAYAQAYKTINQIFGEIQKNDN